MRRLSVALIAAVSAVAFTQIASAADLPRKAPAYTPPPPVYSWTGWYIGLNAGYGWENTIDNSVTSSTCFSPPLASIDCPFVANAFATAVPGQFNDHPKGFIGGGQIGYNYQFSPNWLAGVEADFQGADIKGDDSKANSVSFALVDPIANVAGTGSQKIDWFGTLRGRLGWLPVNPLLIYATGGLAYGHTKTDVSWSGGVSSPPFNPNGGSTAVSLSDTRVGWTVGGGLEWMFAPRWSVKAEYLYYDLGTVSFDSSLALSISGLTPPVYEVLNIHSEAHYHGNIVRGGVNYHF